MNLGCFGRGGLRFERMSGADARPGCLVGAGQRGVPVGCVQFGECGQIGRCGGTRPGCLLGIKGVVGRGVGVDVAGRWFHPVPESPDPGMVSRTCRM